MPRPTTEPGTCAECAGPLPIPRDPRTRYCQACPQNKRTYVKEYRQSYAVRTRAKQRDKMRQWRAKTPSYKARSRARHLRNKYGITQEQYDAMLAAQNTQCAICGADSPGGRTRVFHVDHDHSTGKVRALLCNRCNSSLGLLCDDPDLMRRAAAYIEAHRNK